MIEANINTGYDSGEDVFISRIPIKPTDIQLLFKRTQLHVRIWFAMFINKAKGQILKYTDLILSESWFSHSQHYVGCSSVSSSESLFVYASNQKTKNSVYPETFTEFPSTYVIESISSHKSDNFCIFILYFLFIYFFCIVISELILSCTSVEE